MTGPTGEEPRAEPERSAWRLPTQQRGHSHEQVGPAAVPPGAWEQTVVLRPSPAPEAVPSRRELRAALGRVRWEASTLAVFVLAPSIMGLFGAMVGAAMVGRSRFWELTDKTRALVVIPLAWLVVVVLRAWVTATWIRPAPGSLARLRVAGDSLAGSFHYGPGVVGLFVAVYLGVLLVRDARWS